MPSGHLVDRPQDDRLQRADAIDRHDRAADAAAPVMRFESSLAPLVRRGEKVDDLVDFADALVQTETDTVERHVLPSESAKLKAITPAMCQGSKFSPNAAFDPDSSRLRMPMRFATAGPNWTGSAAACKGRPGEARLRGCGDGGGYARRHRQELRRGGRCPIGTFADSRSRRFLFRDGRKRRRQDDAVEHRCL